jgi:pilus assembly protein CpaF
VERSGVTVEQARDWIASSFDLALEVARLRDGRSRVLRVAELAKLDDPEVPGQDIFTFLVERTAAGGAIEGAFLPSGILPKVVDELAMRGMSIDTSLFTRPPSR